MSSTQENRRQLYEQLVGSTVAGSYDIVSLMGYGGMGAVYEAIQRNMDRRVALKYIPSHDPVTAARFEREAQTVSKLRHPNTVTVFDFGQADDGFLFLSMELLSGRELTDLIEQESPLAPERAVHIASQICRSLAEAHSTGIVHRDIKPDNVILIDVDGDPDVVKVLDFGIAKAVEREDQQTLTGDGRVIGTPRYMSPEQILSDEIDHRSDIYSLGCILFEMLCGAPPFEAPTNTALMISHTKDAPPPFSQRLDEQTLQQIPVGLEQVVRRAMAKDPADRPQTTDDLRTELEEALTAHKQGRPVERSDGELFDASTSPTAGAEPPTTEPATSQGPNKTLIAAVIAALLAVIGGATTFIVLDDEPEEPVDPLAEAAQRAPADATPPSQRNAEADGADAPPPTVRVGDTRHLRVESDPQGAAVFDGDEHLGETPLNFSMEAPEDLELRLTRDDYEDKDVTLEIDDEREQLFSFELQPERRAQPSRPSPPPAPQQPAAEPDDDPEPDDDDGVPSIQLLDDPGDDPTDDDSDDDSSPRVPTL